MGERSGGFGRGKKRESAHPIPCFLSFFTLDPLFPVSRTTTALPPDVRHRNLERLVIEIVRGAVTMRGRLMLIIEDVQWMNQYSMKLLLKVEPWLLQQLR